MNLPTTYKMPGNHIVNFDQEDYPLICAFSWCCTRGYAYARRVRTSLLTKTQYVYMHRLIMNAKPGEQVDHINRNRLDNRKSNLRLCTHQENNYNRSLKGKCGYRGVRWRKDRDKWEARISVNGRTKHLGYYTCSLDAAKAYNNAALDLRGEFAVLNPL